MCSVGLKRMGSYSSLQDTCLQKPTPSASGSPAPAQLSCRAAGTSEEASSPPAVFFSAGLSAACAPVQQLSARDPKNTQRRESDFSDRSKNRICSPLRTFTCSRCSLLRACLPLRWAFSSCSSLLLIWATSISCSLFNCTSASSWAFG